MRTYRVLLNGTGFRRLIDGKHLAVGFWVSRFVGAATVDGAIAEAMELVRLKPQVEHAYTDLSNVVVESVEPVSGEVPTVQPGFAWFREVRSESS